MTCKKINTDLILQAEIAALLHDLGKYRAEFVFPKNNGPNRSEAHTTYFIDPANGLIDKKLAEILATDPLPDNWLDFSQYSKKQKKLEHLGDLLKFHHGDPSIELGCNTDAELPLIFLLLMTADILDSSYSKGAGAAGGGAPSRLNQDENTCYLATPLGESEKRIISGDICKESKAVQEKLATILSGYGNWDSATLRENRNAIIELYRNDTAKALAETRLPTNDVSLWQHSFSTASIFKAMLARRMLLGDFNFDPNEPIAPYNERLAYLAITWNEDDLINRVHQPKDILGRRMRLLELKDILKRVVELDFCIGNEIYQDRNGIYFLIPSLMELNGKKSDGDDYPFVKKVYDTIESAINDPDLFGGDLNYRIHHKEIGIQLLGLGILIDDKTNEYLIRQGPKEPLWMSSWEGKKSVEVCSCCALRPVDITPVTYGSENTKKCLFCSKLEENAANERKTGKGLFRKRLLGSAQKDEFTTYKTDEMVKEFSENKRLALVQGMFDLRHIMSGDAFSSILSTMPEDFSGNIGKKNLPLGTWNALYSSMEKCYENIAQNGPTTKNELSAIRRLFQDSRIGKSKGNSRDGRVPGKTSDEKLTNYINNIVLQSAFSPGMSNLQKIIFYALRQHPAPSRLARIWETTENICSSAVTWCHENKIRYFPVSLDTGRFLLLVPAANAFQFITAMYEKYIQSVGRVRHLLPMHLSASIFYYKSPLYVGIDAMRRFSDISLKNDNPELWRLDKIENGNDFWFLDWTDHKGRKLKWTIPANLPNNTTTTDDFYSWFWVKDENRPYRLCELKKNQCIYIRPSTFDFEVLDTTSRRYDIRLPESHSGRPHLFCGEQGPRPYPLSVIERWNSKDLSSFFSGTRDQSPLNNFISMAGRLHQDKAAYNEALFYQQLRDHLIHCFGKEGIPLTDAAVSGEIFDMYEWHHFIGK